MSLLGMRYFLVAAEEMNFTSAAKRLYVTQQTLSSHIQRLEQEYNVTLFNRRPHLSLTPEGELMVKYATRIIRLERVMSAEFADLDKSARGVLSLGISRMRAKHFFHEIWNRYRSQFPNMEIYLNEGFSVTLERLVSTHKVDMCIGIELESPSLSKIPLCQENIYLVIPRAMFRAYYGEQTEKCVRKFSHGLLFRELPELPLLLLSSVNRIRQLIDQQFDRVDRIAHPVFESNDQELLASMCKDGVGMTFLPATSLFYAKDSVISEELYCFPLSELRIETVLGYPSDKLPHYAKAFISCCMDVFSDADKRIRDRSEIYLNELRGELSKQED